MSFPAHFGFYDILLILVVSGMGACTAWLHNPRLKVLVMLLPLPSTLSALAIGRPIDYSFPMGLLLLPLFYYIIRLLYLRLKVGIIAAIALSAFVYCLAGFAVFHSLHDSALLFWGSFLAVYVLAGGLLLGATPKAESGYRSEVPPALKMILIAGVVSVLLNLKLALGGFMAIFPMAGVVSSYEVRHCLGTVSIQLPLMLILIAMLFATCYLTQPVLGLPGGLATGWMVYLVMLGLMRKHWLPDTITEGCPACQSTAS